MNERQVFFRATFQHIEKFNDVQTEFLHLLRITNWWYWTSSIIAFVKSIFALVLSCNKNTFFSNCSGLCQDVARCHSDHEIAHRRSFIIYPPDNGMPITSATSIHICWLPFTATLFLLLFSRWLLARSVRSFEKCDVICGIVSKNWWQALKIAVGEGDTTPRLFSACQPESNILATYGVLLAPIL